MLAREGPATEDYNCHGWVFADSRYWVQSEDVSPILEDNGYTQVNSPRPGDVVVYRQRGLVVHSGLVREVAGDRIEMEGKWGWMSRFRHPVEKSIFGADYRFYRSSRSSHQLAGLPDEVPDLPPNETDERSDVGDQER